MEEFCPNCGQWFSEVNPDSGFCFNCDPILTAPEIRWLLIHADHVEVYMLQGFSFTKAKKQVLDDNRPTCICCGKPIKGGKPYHIFCTVNKGCRRAQRRYRTLREASMRKGYTLPLAQEAALRQIVREMSTYDRVPARPGRTTHG